MDNQEEAKRGANKRYIIIRKQNKTKQNFWQLYRIAVIMLWISIWLRILYEAYVNDNTLIGR